MPNELYRTYEVLIEETVAPGHPKRAKTRKAGGYKTEIHDALCTTNELFQDAVCYYTILLAGLAGDDEERRGLPLNPLWREIAGEGKFKAQADHVVQRLADKFKSLTGCKTAEDLREKTLFQHNLTVSDTAEGFSEDDRKKLGAMTYRILEQKGIERGDDGGLKGCEDLSEFASGWASIICDPTGGTKIPGTGVFDLLQCRLMRAELTQSEADHAIEEVFRAARRMHKIDFNTKFKREFAKCTTENEKRRKLNGKRQAYARFLRQRRANARKTVGKALEKAAFAKKASKLELTEEDFSKLKQQMAGLAEKLPNCHPHLRRLRYGERDNSFEAVVLRYWWVKHGPDHAIPKRAELLNVAWKDLLVYVHDSSKRPERPPEVDGRTVEVMPYAKHYRIAFPLFAKHCLAVETEDRSPWWEFDKTAFATAAEDVFKYKIRALQRQAKVDQLRAVKGTTLEQNSVREFKPEDSPTGKRIVVRGMKDDSRRTKMEKLLREMAEEKGINSYGLDTGTIGGWADVRERFLELEAKGQATEANLVAAVDESQTENRQGFGSADFFHALCQTEYHQLWSRAGASTDCAKVNGISDFVAYYTRYSEWIEDLTQLEPEEGTIKPISYTFPGMPNRHGDVSQRHFNFKAPLNTEFVFPKLFARENGSFKLLSGDEAVKVTLSARRLKRDRIVNAQGDSLGALWCPPLVLAEGDGRPRAGKLEGDRQRIKDISFSLMVSVTTDESFKPPVHLKVQVPITADQVKKLESATPFWRKGSLRGYAKKGDADADKRKHWVWPRDLETSKKDEEQRSLQDKVKPSELWCGDSTRDAFRLGFRKRSADGKWRIEDALVPNFHVLSVDLGNRFCAAFARLRVHTDGRDEKTRGRLLSPDHNWATPMYAQLVEKGTLRLQGEDTKIWKLGAAEPTREPYGNDGRGRFPSEDQGEIATFLELADAIIPQSSAPIRAADAMTYPEMGDHLVWRFRRRLSRIRTLFKLRWFAHPDAKKWNPKTGHYDLEFLQKEREDNRRKAVEILAKMYSRPKREEDEEEDLVYRALRLALATEDEWATTFPKQGAAKKNSVKDKDVVREAVRQWKIGGGRWMSFHEKLDKQLNEHLEGGSEQHSTRALLERVVEWCLPLRKRHWHWKPDKEKPLLTQGKHGPKDEDCEAPTHIPFVRGMRGLSLRRLEQILNIRQLCQSYARTERRWMQPDTGINDLVIKRGEDLHDPCPDLLVKSNALREQRVYQTAHLILTEALGLELKNPAEVERDGKTKKQLKSEVDLHGAYQPKSGKDGNTLPRCSVIVLEDLTRYRTSQERTRAENSRLMKWAHRAIVSKLADMAKPFGITIMLVDPAFSSRFDSRTGIAGIRVSEVSRGFEKEMPFASWRTRVKQNGAKDELATQIDTLVDRFKKHPEYQGTLLLAVEGGKLFLPAAVSGRAYQSESSAEGLLNADENAAANIGLRALAHPDRWDIFPRLRTRLSDSVAHVRNRRGWLATCPEGDLRRELRRDWSGSVVPKVEQRPPATSKTLVNDEESGESSAFPDFFAVVPGVTDFDALPDAEAYHLCGEAAQYLPEAKIYQRRLFLPRIQQVCLGRVEEINTARLNGSKKEHVRM